MGLEREREGEREKRFNDNGFPNRNFTGCLLSQSQSPSCLLLAGQSDGPFRSDF